MKNDFFEAFDEIDEKYINEAANMGYEVSYAEEIKPTGLRKRIYPIVIKYAACAAVVGAAVFAVTSAAGFGEAGLTPNSPGVSDFETEETYSEAVTLAPYQYETDHTLVEVDPPQTLSEEENEAREAACKDWDSRILVSPSDSELPDYYTEYTTNFYARKFTGWAGMVLPAPEMGSEVKAISDGEVVFAGIANKDDIYHDKNEYFVVIKHNDYVYTGYRGIDPNTSLNVGDIVEAGQCVGYANLEWIDDKPAFIFDIGESDFGTSVEYAE